MAELPPPPEGIALAHFIVSDDVERSRRFYTEVLGGRVIFSGPGGLTYVALSNCWIIINVGGGPTDDKPAPSPWRRHPTPTGSVASSISGSKTSRPCTPEWSARGAQFSTPPKQHQYEIRCYIRDPDGHLIEVGQTTDPEGDWVPAHWPAGTLAAELSGGVPNIDGGPALGHWNPYEFVSPRDHRHWRARIGCCPPPGLRRRERCGYRAPTLSRPESWPQTSAALSSWPPTTATCWWAPMRSSLPFGLLC